MALTDKLTAIANAIRAKTGKSDSLTLDQMPTEIANITGGGGSSADVRYVTFTNPATGETFVKPVAVGDDCVDVVARGLWATPTQASTAQYDYAFANSWSAEPGGAADADILKNITEDKTVYAVFTATLRKYTITWLDEDGTELPGQKQWAYGTIPSYTPTKEGYGFEGWTPTPVKVTGDATYTATWSEGIGGTLTDTAVWLFDESTGVLTIRGTGEMPSYTEITGQPWRKYWHMIKKVVVEEGITALGERCFQEASYLTEVSLPSTLRGKIANHCFYSCIELKSIIIPEGITSIGEYAFCAARGFAERTSVVLPQSLTRIENSAFQYATNLKAIDIPANVNYIGKNAFGGNNYNAMSLANVYFANPNGWWVSSSADATSGTAVTVTSASTAASYLKNTYKERYWHRT